MSLDPKTREEQYLSAIANGSEVSSVAVTREEKFLQGILNGEPPALKPITRKEMFYKAIAEGGTPGGSSGGSSGGGGEEWIGDGNTHIWISLAEGRTNPMVGVGVKGTITVDWGDGSEPDTLTGTSVDTVVFTPRHEYGKAGDYVITLSGEGQIGIGRSTGGSQLLVADTTANAKQNYVYRNAIQKVECGNSVTSIGQYAFGDCYALSSVSIPDSVTSIGMFAFYKCYALSSVTIPDSVTSIGNGVFQSCHTLVSATILCDTGYVPNYTLRECYSLKSVTIPDNVTEIRSGSFSSCYSLTSMVVPPSVSNILAGAFENCYAVVCYDFSNHTVVPTLSATSAFTYIPADCIFKIPASLYDEWINATNWSSIAATNTFVGG